MRKIRSNDEVVVITGKDKGRRGKITQVLANGKVLVQGVNRVKKHVKPNPNAGVQGGIIEKEMPMDASNVMLVNPATGKGDRVGFKLLEDGKKIRVFKSNGERVDA
ncbi:50S ribosomal protein L24 [Thiothrix nivea]|uniref:Large ribosomal subunit protein uL24 n=1 Tax=Thiothrix nivea (strain ATCC 35100 / DSM 5205 / JP2) TaxID=870187 RepID=A0A656HG12_THINJ|nr:50S ribosomal protein L24 [Thiothrix nivea]EIJ35838.1 LSU ribosomal protein L24P [Thiothrix nivea DSM 5205]